MIYEICLKKGKAIKSTKVLMDAESKEEALTLFKKQRVHESGVSKKDYVAALYLVE